VGRWRAASLIVPIVPARRGTVPRVLLGGIESYPGPYWIVAGVAAAVEVTLR
jgi:hypothetical protein